MLYGFLLVASVCAVSLSPRISEWMRQKREENYNLAVRRKFGIPDWDRRPFGVAQAAAAREKEKQKAELRPRRETPHVQFEFDEPVLAPPRLALPPQPAPAPVPVPRHQPVPSPAKVRQAFSTIARPEKRARDDEEHVLDLDKRVRPRVEEEEEEEEEPMDVDARDQVVEETRGKKRDRLEAGSTFGDEITPDDHKEKRRRRKSKRQSEMGPPPLPRGVKRGVEDDDTDLEFQGDEDGKKKKNKKGRKSRSLTYDEDADPLDGEGMRVDDQDVEMSSPIPGKEWESNGVRYKYNGDNQRVRLCLVKKEGKRYHMVSVLCLDLRFHSPQISRPTLPIPIPIQYSLYA